MTDSIIRVDKLGKRYRIGARQEGSETFREAFVSLLGFPFRYLRQMRRPPTEEEALWALRDVSFEVKQGEVLGIIGRNGAGKSTLLKILSRITEPTEGRAELHGRVGALLEVGTGFHPELTGRENIYLNGTILGMKRVEINRKFDEIVAFSGVEKFIDTPVKRYSSGMYVRLAFAVAAHLEPEILLVDEVLAVGDAAFQKKCLGKMGKATTEGRTVLFVSHNMVAVRTLCPRVFLLEDGRITLVGDPNTVVSYYLGSSETDNSSERVWDDPARAPGCESLRLHRVRVSDLNGDTVSDVSIQNPLNIELEYLVLKPGIRAGATVLIWNQEGTLVLSSISNADPNWHGQMLPKGTFRSVCQLPGNFLNSGRHSVSVLLWKDNYVPSTREDEVVYFEVLDTGGVRGDYFGGWGGVVRPWLNWRTDYLGERE